MSEILGAVFKAVVMLLGIGAVVAVAITSFNASKNSNAVAEMSQLVFNIQSAYSSGAFTSLTNNVAVSGERGGRLAPESMISGSSLVNPWGGAVTVRVNAGNAATFDVVTERVSSSGCQKLAMNMSMALKVSINAVDQALPMDVGTAIANCIGSANTLELTFGH